MPLPRLAPPPPLTIMRFSRDMTAAAAVVKFDCRHQWSREISSSTLARGRGSRRGGRSDYNDHRRRGCVRARTFYSHIQGGFPERFDEKSLLLPRTHVRKPVRFRVVSIITVNNKNKMTVNRIIPLAGKTRNPSTRLSDDKTDIVTVHDTSRMPFSYYCVPKWHFLFFFFLSTIVKYFNFDFESYTATPP